MTIPSLMAKKRSLWRIVKRLTLLMLLALLAVGATFWYGQYAVEHAAEGLCYSDVADLPNNRVALVLGTGKRTGRGNINLYFKYRRRIQRRAGSAR